MRISKSRLKKGIRLVGVPLTVVFVLLNIVLAVAYHQKTYPKTQLGGKLLGSVAYSKLAAAGEKLKILPATITVKYKDQRAEVNVNDLGLKLDGKALEKAAQQNKDWLPVANGFRNHNLPVAVQLDDGKVAKYGTVVASVFSKSATNAAILKGKDFSITKSENGWALDQTKLKAAILETVAAAKTTVEVPTRAVKPAVVKEDLVKPLADLQKQLSTEITIAYGSQKKVTTPEERISWYVPDNLSFVLSKDAIAQFVQTAGANFGITVENTNDVATNIIKNMQTNTKQSFTLIKAAPTKTYSYCVSARGITYDMSIVSAKLAQTYADPRGWSLGGQVRFVPVASGCDFTVWLSAASQMPTFGSICDSMWSCRVSANVVLNADRWNGASDAWNAAKLGLEDYRSMVINHETGHWFGFNHSDCPGTGQLAPVMQQQSISLQGCTFNPWPLPSEQARLKSTLGL